VSEGVKVAVIVAVPAPVKFKFRRLIEATLVLLEE
jgi:hypothetical protein